MLRVLCPKDIIHKYGLSFHKPSTVLPQTEHCPSTNRARCGRLLQTISQRGFAKVFATVSARLFTRGRKMGSSMCIRLTRKGTPQGLPSRPTTPDYTVPVSTSGQTLHPGGAGTVPLPTSVGGVRSHNPMSTVLIRAQARHCTREGRQLEHKDELQSHELLGWVD